MKTLKKILIIVLVLIPEIITGISLLYPGDAMSAPQDHILQSNGQVTSGVVSLLGWTGIRVKNDTLPIDPRWPEEKLTIPSRSLKDVVAATNVHWSQNKKTETGAPLERWEMKGEFTPDQIENIVSVYFDDLKLGEDVLPQHQAYQGILFLGATLPCVRSRLAYLNKVIDEQSLTGPIYLLTGERVLNEGAKETEQDLLTSLDLPIKTDWNQPKSLPKDEAGMVQMVFDQSKHSSLKETDIIMVYTPKRPGDARATREGTIIEWLKSKPKDGVYLAIASQPYNLHQNLDIQRVLHAQGRPNIIVEVIGPPVDEKKKEDYKYPQKVTVLLDNLNRIFLGLNAVSALK